MSHTSTGERPIYLDYNATTPVLPEALGRHAALPAERFGNPSSLHPYGQEGRRGVDRAREQVADLLGCSSDEIIFTSGGTESNNLAIFGTTRDTGGPGHVVTSSVIEHPAVLHPCQMLDVRATR